MTVKEKTAGKSAPPTSPVDIKEVLNQSASDVTVSDLAKKGFKQVKVLKKDVITRLIQEAVERVITSREQQISSEEKKKVVEQSKAEFDALAKERTQLDRKYQETLKEKERQVEELSAKLAEAENSIRELRENAPPGGGSSAMEGLVVSLLERLQSQQPQEAGQNVAQLQNSIEGLANKISNLSFSGGGAGGGAEIVDKEVILERLFSRDDESGMESNVNKVNVKKAKAKGVKSSLNKLKSLQQGGTQDGE